MRSVSNPHRYGQKREARRAKLPPEEAFQTLIGTVKRALRDLPEQLTDEVSNPHRYGQKGEVPPSGIHGHREFQTLIGTVKSSKLRRTSANTITCFKPS